jgi:cytochrome c-type biogenesis protein CcmH
LIHELNGWAIAGDHMTRSRRRLRIILACGFGVGSATVLALVAFRSNLMVFVAPAELIARAPWQGQVLEWMVACYGNSVRPWAAFDVETALLWSAPVLALATGSSIVAVSRRRTAYRVSHPSSARRRIQAVGDITETERDGAVIDVQRRLLTSADERGAELRKGAKTSLRLALAGVPAIALALYLKNGLPNLPSVTGGSLIAEPAIPPEAESKLSGNLRAQATSLPANSAEARSIYIALGRAEADRGDMSAAAVAWNVALTINFDSTLAAATAEALSESVDHVDTRAAALFRRALASAPADAPWRPMVIKRLAEAKSGSDASSSSSGAGN